MFLSYSPTGTEGDADQASELVDCLAGRLDACSGTVVKCLAEKETAGGQILHADTCGRLLPLAMKQLSANVCAAVEYDTGEGVISRRDWNVLKVVRTPSIGETYLAVPMEWFQETGTELLGAIQDCYVGTLEFEGEVVLLQDHTIQLYSRHFEN